MRAEDLIPIDDLKAQLRFDSLLVDLSSRFVNLSPDDRPGGVGLRTSQDRTGASGTASERRRDRAGRIKTRCSEGLSTIGHFIRVARGH